MKVHELAKKHGKKPEEIKKIIRDLGFTIKDHHMTVVSEEIEKAVVAKLRPQPEVNLLSQSPVKEIEKAVKQPEPITTVASSDNGEVIFFSPSRCHDIAYKKETYFGASAKIKTPAKSIRFDDYEYRTSDPEEIAHIKSTRSFTVRSKDYPNGKIRIVTEDQLRVLKQARAPRMTGTKATDDKATNSGDVDFGKLNAVPI